MIEALGAAVAVRRSTKYPLPGKRVVLTASRPPSGSTIVALARDMTNASRSTAGRSREDTRNATVTSARRTSGAPGKGRRPLASVAWMRRRGTTRPTCSPTSDAYPDLEAPNLHAVDASDRLILDEAAPALAEVAGGEGVVVIGDHHGALTLGAIARHGLSGVRTHQDRLLGERALQANAERLGLGGFAHARADAGARRRREGRAAPAPAVARCARRDRGPDRRRTLIPRWSSWPAVGSST